MKKNIIKKLNKKKDNMCKMKPKKKLDPKKKKKATKKKKVPWEYLTPYEKARLV